MCMGGSPKVPEAIKYAQVKTPALAQRNEARGGNSDAVRRRRALASGAQATGARGLQSQAALSYKTLLGQ